MATRYAELVERLKRGSAAYNSAGGTVYDGPTMLEDEAAAAITALEAEVERADDVRDTLVTTLRAVDLWAKAYPTEVFVEPDFAEVQRLLGSTLLSQVSASNMRHVLTGVAGLVAHALASIESKP